MANLIKLYKKNVCVEKLNVNEEATEEVEVIMMTLLCGVIFIMLIKNV